MLEDPRSFIFFLVAIIFAVTIHEYCHAWVANYLGDPTARLLGRLTLNPLAHFDLFGTLALIFIHFGWGKPVPVNPQNFNHPRRDSALVSLAGPFSNFLTAVAVAIPLKYLQDTAFASTPGYELLRALFYMSVVLCALNILPFPPLDGSKIIGIFIPHKFSYQYERYLAGGSRYFIFFVLFDVFIGKELYGGSILSKLVGIVSEFIFVLIGLGT